MKKKLTQLIVGLLLCQTVVTGCTIGDTEYVLDLESISKKDYVFSINGEECTKEEAKLYLCNYQVIYGNEYGVNLWEHDFGPMDESLTLETYVKDITLSQLANIMCMNLLAEEQEVSLTDGELKKVKQAAEEYYNTLSKDEIAYMGIDKKKVQAIYEKYALAQKLYDTLTQGVNEEVSDDEARVIRVQQIYVSSEEDASEVQAKLANGDDFASVASNYNEANTIETTMKRGAYPEAVDQVAFHLDNGEKSDMITTDQGYYFIKCLNKYEVELTEENKINIIAQRRKEQFDDVFNGFITESKFELIDEVWDEIDIDTSGAITTGSFFEIYDKHFGK